jgi:hypothetical protein
MLQQPETTPQSPAPHKKRGDPARIAPFGSSLALRRVPSSFGCVHALRRLHHDRLCLDFEPRLDGGLIQPLLLCATRFGAMHSPSGSLLTPRVSFWTHWRSFDRHVPCAVVVSLDLKVSSYRGLA